MPADDRHAALIALLRHATPRRAAELLQTRGTAREALEHALGGGQLMLGADPGADTARALADAKAELRSWETDGIEVVAIDDAAYPVNLKTARDRPLMLTMRGQLTPDDDRAVAVVGSRLATPDGLRQAHTAATALVEAGFVVVSGLAAGIDTAAHSATLDAGGRTIAVIGTGLNHTYPRENAALQARLARDHLVVSQFWPDQPPRQHTFPMRTALMAGISLATVIVQAADDSGARRQARVALENQRPVVLTRWLVGEQQWAREFAEQPGVHVADMADLGELVSDLCRDMGDGRVRTVARRIAEERGGALQMLADYDAGASIPPG